MAKDRKIKLTIDCEIDTSFWSYGSKKLDKNAITSIKENIKEILENNLNFIDIEIEEETYDYVVCHNDATEKSKIHIKGHRIYSKK